MFGMFLVGFFMFFNVFIGIINFKKKFFLLYLIKFYAAFSSRSRHLQIEVGGWYGWFCHFGVIWNKKVKMIIVGFFMLFNVFIGIINLKKKNFLLYLIKFYDAFSSRSRHLQIEVGGWYGWFCHFGVIWNKKVKMIIVQYARGSVPN